MASSRYQNDRQPRTDNGINQSMKTNHGRSQTKIFTEEIPEK